jgi:hypothetical protein
MAPCGWKTYFVYAPEDGTRPRPARRSGRQAPGWATPTVDECAAFSTRHDGRQLLTAPATRRGDAVVAPIYQSGHIVWSPADAARARPTNSACGSRL